MRASLVRPGTDAMRLFMSSAAAVRGVAKEQELSHEINWRSCMEISEKYQANPERPTDGRRAKFLGEFWFGGALDSKENHCVKLWGERSVEG